MRKKADRNILCPPFLQRDFVKIRLELQAIEAGLHFAYTGNVPGHPGESTYCPDCKEVLIKRVGYTILQNSMNGNECNNCKHPIPGIWH